MVTVISLKINFKQTSLVDDYNSQVRNGMPWRIILLLLSLLLLLLLLSSPLQLLLFTDITQQINKRSLAMADHWNLHDWVPLCYRMR